MKRKINALVGASALIHAAPAMAQADALASGIDDIVVTAQKRDQRLQEVPISVSAISGDTLQDRGVTDLT